MKTRDDITIRFADNGIIVTPVAGSYSRDNPGMRNELVFNSVIEFEKWFEHHTGEGDEEDYWPRINNGRRDHHKEIKEWLKIVECGRQMGKTSMQERWMKTRIYGDWEQGYQFKDNPDRLVPYHIGIDPAKPDSERTVVRKIRQVGGKVEIENTEPADILREALEPMITIAEKQIDEKVAMTNAIDPLAVAGDIVKKYQGAK